MVWVEVEYVYLFPTQYDNCLGLKWIMRSSLHRSPFLTMPRARSLLSSALPSMFFLKDLAAYLINLFCLIEYFIYFVIELLSKLDLLVRCWEKVGILLKILMSYIVLWRKGDLFYSSYSICILLVCRIFEWGPNESVAFEVVFW